MQLPTCPHGTKEVDTGALEHTAHGRAVHASQMCAGTVFSFMAPADDEGKHDDDDEEEEEQPRVEQCGADVDPLHTSVERDAEVSDPNESSIVSLTFGSLADGTDSRSI